MKRTTFRLEQLEDRCVPAVLWWKPTQAGNWWGDNRNWWDDGGFQAASAPGASDTTRFSATTGSDSDCNVESGGRAAIAVRADSTYTHTLSLGGNLTVGANTTSPNPVDSWWDGGNIFFGRNAYAFLKIYCVRDTVHNTGGFAFDGGRVNDSTDPSGATGNVEVEPDGWLNFAFTQGNVTWGATLNVDAAAGTHGAGEVFFPNAGPGQLVWSYANRGTASPQVNNYGWFDFNASDASDTVSGIRGAAGTSWFYNFGTVYFENNPAGRTHEDLPFQNGGPYNTGRISIFDDTIACFDGSALMPNYPKYSYVSYVQWNAGSFTNIIYGAMANKANVVGMEGTFKFGNQLGRSDANSYLVGDNGSNVLGVYMEGASLWGDVSVASAKLRLSNDKLFLGNDYSGTTTVRLDFRTDASGNLFTSQILTTGDFTIETGGGGWKPTLQLNVTGGKPAVSDPVMGAGWWAAIIVAGQISIPGPSSWAISLTGDWTGWTTGSFGWSSFSSNGIYWVHN